VLAVEPVLQRAHSVHGAVDVRVAGKHDEGRVDAVTQRCSRRGSIRICRIKMRRGHCVVGARIGDYRG
jgi:hypothetical protein